MNQAPRNTPNTLAWEPLDSEHILACQRIAVSKVLHLLPDRYIAALQENAPEPCCREVPNLDIEAWYSRQTEADKGVPDIYKFHCNVCARTHARFCVGGSHPTDPGKQDRRPYWEVR